MKFTTCIDIKSYTQKPDCKAAAGINNRIAQNEHSLTIQDLANKIEWGYSWCPATFHNGKKTQANFKSQQLFALDFDGGIPLETVLERAQEYRLPIVLTYETFSSVNCDRFRAVFAYQEPVQKYVVANLIQHTLCAIFPEADKSGKDCTKFYYAGKNTIIYEPINYIDMESLIIGLTSHIRQTAGEKNFTRTLRNFCQQTRLRMNGNLIDLHISECGYDTSSSCLISDKNEDITVYSFYINKDINIKSSFLIGQIFFYTNRLNIDSKNQNIQKAEKSNYIQSFPFGNLTDKCELFRQFSQGDRWLHHMELLLIATNLIQVKGGRKLFNEIIERFPDYYESKNRLSTQIDYAVRNRYLPFSCSNFCPFEDECNHGKNMILTIKLDVSSMLRLKDYNPGYVTLDEAYEDFKDRFHIAMKNLNPGVTVIRAQTGIGKTSAYLDYLKISPVPCVIAVPTNRLKQQVAADARKLGVPVVCTPSVEPIKNIPGIGSILEQLYMQGAEDLVGETLRKMNAELQNPELHNYLNACQNIFQKRGHIITTHARFLYMKPEQLSGYRIIIDEDVFNTSVQVKKVSLEDVKTLQFLKFRMPDLGERIMHILHSIEAGERFFQCPQTNFSSSIRKKFWKSLDTKGLTPQSDVSVLFTSPVFHYSPKRQELFALKIKLPDPTLNIAVFSATVDEQICRQLFSDRPVRFIQCWEAAYKGQIIQNHEKSCSRFCLQSHPELYYLVKEQHPNLPLITFKNYDPKAGMDSLHIGATEGNNLYTGQNIVIVGTPHMPDFLYKLVGLFLGFDISSNLTVQEIEHNGFRLRFCAYENEQLRHLQLWYIESELEQCIGRARLLRNDCTVYLYSNFPVKQTTLEEEWTKGEDGA
ncbi:MAG: hypothetical protein E7476_00125 [Ruminococcaceae bacterium]|nr:hypothetical protein [Oscillospiraceae bacterium]